MQNEQTEMTPTDAAALLTTDAREIADAARSAWQAWSAWTMARNQLNRLLDEAYTKHRAGIPAELGLGPFMFESITSNLDAGNVQYLLRAIERKRAMGAEA